MTFAELLNIVKPQKHEIFYDLGCGTGKPVFAAHLICTCVFVCVCGCMYGVCASAGMGCMRLFSLYICVRDCRYFCIIMHALLTVFWLCLASFKKCIGIEFLEGLVVVWVWLCVSS